MKIEIRDRDISRNVNLKNEYVYSNVSFCNKLLSAISSIQRSRDKWPRRAE